MWEGAGVPAGEVPYGLFGMMMGVRGGARLHPARALAEEACEGLRWEVHRGGDTRNTAPGSNLGGRKGGDQGWDSRYTDPFVHTKTILILYWVSGTGDVGGNKAKSLVSALTFRWRRQKRNS